MLHTNYRFREENGRLKVSEDFVPKDAPSIRLHNKILGFILWLIGKAKFIETRDAHGKSKVWAVNAKSLAKWMPKMIPADCQCKNNDIEALLFAVKSDVKRKKRDALDKL